MARSALRQFHLMALAICALCHIAFAASSVPADFGGVQRIDLSGQWDFRLDPERAGESEQWFRNDPGSWSKLAVPGSYNEQLAGNAIVPDPSDAMRFYYGAAWYRTSFDTPADLFANNALCFLHLSGTVLRHTVWVNGVRLGSSREPYLDAAYDATPLLHRNGPNTLVVEVDNKPPAHGIPDNYWHGWWNDGGLIRPVYLELRPATHGRSYATTTMQPGGGWKLTVQTELAQPAGATAEVSYTLSSAEGAVVWHSPVLKAAQPEVDAVIPGVLPWSPEHPVLYTLTTTIHAQHGTADITTVRIGFRQIEVRGTHILLNGRPLQVRGLSRHQFFPGAGMSMTVAQDRKDMEEIKSLGANFVRLAHYSQSQDVYDACDELGILVWNEIPAWQSNKVSLADESVWTDYAQPQLHDMVMQHRNHPSVVVWSVANEIPSDTPIGEAYVARAIAYVKTLDRSRLVTFASDRRNRDKSFGSADFIAVNEYFGWYYGAVEDAGPMLDALHRQFPDKPILVSEFGDEGLANWDKSMMTADGRDYSDANQVAFLDAHLKQIYARQRRSFVAGGLIWLFNDFPDPHQTDARRPKVALYRNSKGLVTMDREHKPAFASVQRFFLALQSER